MWVSKKAEHHPGFFERYVVSWIKFFIRERRARKKPIPGIPQALNPDLLKQVIRSNFAEELADVSFVHLSTWKRTGAYRLMVKTEKGRRIRFIYKHAHYNLSLIPALADFPLLPGAPEFLVYSQADAGLRKYLPRVYHSQETIPGELYEFFLEDLDEDHRLLVTRRNRFLAAISGLVNFQQAMMDWRGEIDSNRLLQFNRAYSNALLGYAKHQLEAYEFHTSNIQVKKVLMIWDKISEIHQRDDFYIPSAFGMIHGDFQSSNIYYKKGHPSDIRVIDWEWSGIGKKHADLASLLKGADDEVEEKAVAHYIEHHPMFSASEHLQLYEWCHLERGLQAAFLAKQQLESDKYVGWIPEFVDRSMKRLQLAYQRLA